MAILLNLVKSCCVHSTLLLKTVILLINKFGSEQVFSFENSNPYDYNTCTTPHSFVYCLAGQHSYGVTRTHVETHAVFNRGLPDLTSLTFCGSVMVLFLFSWEFHICIVP